MSSDEGLYYWLKALAKEAGVKPTGTIRFHLLRKYTFDVASVNCGSYEAKLLVGKSIPLADGPLPNDFNMFGSCHEIQHTWPNLPKQGIVQADMIYVYSFCFISFDNTRTN